MSSYLNKRLMVNFHILIYIANFSKPKKESDLPGGCLACGGSLSLIDILSSFV